MPNYFWSRFKAQVHNASTNFMINDLEHVEPPSTLFSTINLQDGGYMVFVANTKRLQEYGLVRACGYPGAKDEYGHDSRIFFARSLSWIGP